MPTYIYIYIYMNMVIGLQNGHQQMIRHPNIYNL